MAITAVETGNYPVGNTVVAYTADLSGTEELIAAPGAGNKLALEYLAVNAVVAAGAETVTIGTGETAGAVTTEIVPQIAFTPSDGFVQLHFRKPLLLPANANLTADASAAFGVTVVVQYTVVP